MSTIIIVENVGPERTLSKITQEKMGLAITGKPVELWFSVEKSDGKRGFLSQKHHVILTEIKRDKDNHGLFYMRGQAMNSIEVFNFKGSWDIKKKEGSARRIIPKSNHFIVREPALTNLLPKS